MRFAVDTWEPDYGSGTEAAALSASEVPTTIDVEVAVADWAPRSVDAAEAEEVLFIDGVRRVEARVWITEASGDVHLGLAASYGAGIVSCRSGARPMATVVAADVERRLFTAAPSAQPIATAYGTFAVTVSTGETAEELSLSLQTQMGTTELRLAREAATTRPEALLIVDGPLRSGGHLRGTVGSIKTQHRSYGPPIVQQTVADLTAGQRTPVFAIGDRFARWSWYLRLPGPVPHRLASVVRCEVDADLPVDEVVRLADTVCATLPRFASSPAKDSRAPQNLYPIGGLERHLRHLLGDAPLLMRGLRRAAA